MNRTMPFAYPMPFARALLHLLALGAALLAFTACDGGTAEQPPPAADAGPPDAPVVPDVAVGIPADARACEVMLFDPEGRVLDVVFGAAVEGRTLRRGDRLAFAFAHRADAPIAGGAIALATGGDEAAVEVESSACFDRAGRPLAEAAVALRAL